MTTVWLPESPESFGGLPGGMTADVWTGGGPLPDSAGQVEVVVMPFRVRPELIAKVAQLPNLKLIQLRSAGAEAVLPYVPDHVTLCNARGAHDPVGSFAAHLAEGIPDGVGIRGVGPGHELFIASLPSARLLTRD